MKNFQCPYKDISCIWVDTLVNDKVVKCPDCVHYGDGVRMTGAMPVLEYFLKTLKDIWLRM
jgi:hypothetical protein